MVIVENREAMKTYDIFTCIIVFNIDYAYFYLLQFAKGI